MIPKRNNFKSLSPLIDSLELKYLLNRFNCKQYNIQTVIFPDENKYWKKEELYNFHITESSVDRIYFFATTWICTYEFRILLRMQYKSNPLYVELLNPRNENEKKIMILTYHIQRFIDSIVSDYGERDSILKFMLYDDKNVQKSWNIVSSLEHLCYEELYTHKDKNWKTFKGKIIPISVWNRMNDNIEMKKIKDLYERKIIMIDMVQKKPDLYPWINVE